MKRRVPKQMRSSGGLFNYIPEPCQEFEKFKRCRFGDSCPRSHGWLEIIFHPLLYKTKLCKSRLQNGVCSEYGIYCAKAHARAEIRSLVEIYGEKWKRHYVLSDRMKVRRNDHFRKPNLNTARNLNYKMGRVGRAVVPKTRHMLDVNLFAQYILDGKISQIEKPPMCLEQRSPKDELLTDSDILFEDIRSPVDEEKSPDIKTCSYGEGKEITSYTQLYTPDVTLVDDHLRHCSPVDQVVESHSLRSPNDDIHMASSVSASIMNEDWENKVTLYANDWGDCSFSDVDKGDSSSLTESPKIGFCRAI